ncbi:MAG: hypothetical protein FWG84_00915 [Bacteroidales bacterium]|nr:hypothetical protein [Bacteroidales bacterium]
MTHHIHTLQRSSTQQAIEKLSDNLHFDIGIAKALRLDVSTVIPTKRPPPDYYTFLGQKPYFNRLQSNADTLYYNNHQRQLILYDKVKEAKNSNTKVPDIFKNDNLLRYEMRITKRVAKQFKTDVTGATLYDEVFYYAIVQQWYNEFKTIQKLKSRDFMIDNVSSKKEAKEALFSYLLQQQGQDIISEFLNELKAERKFSSRSDYAKLKAELNKMIVAKNGNKNDLVTELETAIFDVAKYAR